MLDVTPETVQIIIQGGAVGILLMFGVMGYRIMRLAIDRVADFVGNHLEHNTEAIAEGTSATKEMAADIRRLVDRLDNN